MNMVHGNNTRTFENVNENKPLSNSPYLKSLRYQYKSLNDPLLTCKYELLKNELSGCSKFDNSQLICIIDALLYELFPIDDHLKYDEQSKYFIEVMYAQLPLAVHGISNDKIKAVYIDLELLKFNDSLQFIDRNDIPKNSNENNLMKTIDGGIIILTILKEEQKQVCSSLMIELSTLILVSIAKKGNATENCIKMIAKEININNNNIFNFENIYLIWNHIKQIVNPDNIERIINYFKMYITKDPISLDMMLSDLKWAGLTSLIIIKEAYITYPYFAWRQMENMFPKEVDILSIIYKIISQIPYYGYSNDERIAKSNFKNVLYVAKQVLLTMDSERIISRSNSIVDKPINYNVLDKFLTEEKIKMPPMRICKVLPVTNSILLPIIWKYMNN